MNLSQVCLLTYCGLAHLLAGEPNQEYEVGYSVDGSIGQWKVKGVLLRETLTETWGILTVENGSKAEVRNGRFSVQFFDEQGRKCFSLVFSSEDNEEQDSRPFRPGATRRLLGIGAGISPISTPATAKVYSVDSGPSGGVRDLSLEERFNAPVTFRGGIAPKLITFTPALVGPEESYADLLLADVSVSGSGKVLKTRVLRSVNDEVRRWFEEHVMENGFNPATAELKSQPGRCIVLVRVVIKPVASDIPLPRDSTMVKAELTREQLQSSPTVLTALFYPHPAEARPHETGKSMSFKLITVGDGWGTNVLEWRAVIGAPGLTRAWRDF